MLRSAISSRLPAALRAPNLVCLDAALVAVVWQATLARAFGCHVSLAARAALLLTTWAIYLFDRIADGASLAAGVETSARQAFARRHARGLSVLLGAVVVADALAIARLDAHLFATGAVLGLGCAVYLTTNRLADRLWRVLPIKELAIGVLFALGTSAPLLPSARAPILGSVVLFALLCAANCATVAAWEEPLDARQGKTTIGTRYPNLAPVIPIAFALIAAMSTQLPRAVGVPLATSALLLGLLHAARKRLAPDDRTALADLVLLAPLLFLR